MLSTDILAKFKKIMKNFRVKLYYSQMDLMDIYRAGVTFSKMGHILDHKTVLLNIKTVISYMIANHGLKLEINSMRNYINILRCEDWRK